jgi:hypothetical protein
MWLRVRAARPPSSVGLGSFQNTGRRGCLLLPHALARRRVGAVTRRRRRLPCGGGFASQTRRRRACARANSRAGSPLSKTFGGGGQCIAVTGGGERMRPGWPKRRHVCCRSAVRAPEARGRGACAPGHVAGAAGQQPRVPAPAVGAAVEGHRDRSGAGGAGGRSQIGRWRGPRPGARLAAAAPGRGRAAAADACAGPPRPWWVAWCPRRHVPRRAANAGGAPAPRPTNCRSLRRSTSDTD